MYGAHNTKGFTLVEILLVTVILAILISIVTPQFRRTFDNLQFKNFVLDIQMLALCAHDKAVLEKQVYRLHYVDTPPAYRLEKATNEAPGNAAQTFAPLKERLGAKRMVPYGLKVDMDSPEIIFYPDGTASDTQWRWSDSRGQENILHVDTETGETRIEQSHE